MIDLKLQRILYIKLFVIVIAHLPVCFEFIKFSAKKLISDFTTSCKVRICPHFLVFRFKDGYHFSFELVGARTLGTKSNKVYIYICNNLSILVFYIIYTYSLTSQPTAKCEIRLVSTVCILFDFVPKNLRRIRTGA